MSTRYLLKYFNTSYGLTDTISTVEGTLVKTITEFDGAFRFFDTVVEYLKHNKLDIKYKNPDLLKHDSMVKMSTTLFLQDDVSQNKRHEIFDTVNILFAIITKTFNKISIGYSRYSKMFTPFNNTVFMMNNFDVISTLVCLNFFPSDLRNKLYTNTSIKVHVITDILKKCKNKVVSNGKICSYSLDTNDIKYIEFSSVNGFRILTVMILSLRTFGSKFM